MGGKCIEKLPHSCGTRRGLQVFQQEDGSYDGKCFSCGVFVPNPYADKPEGYTPPEPVDRTAQILENLDIIKSCGVCDLPSRRIRGDSLAYYECKVGVSPTDGKQPHTVYFPYTYKGEIVRYKARKLDNKEMWSYSLSKKVELFGWKQAIKSASRRLIITEGEFDAICLYRIFHMYTPEKYKDNIPAIVSIPNGSGGARKDIGLYLKEIRQHFKEIALCFDMDEAGEKAQDEVLKILPEAKVITLPDGVKDVNEGVVKGLAQAVFKAAQWDVSKPKNTKLVWGHTLHEEAKVPAEWGVPWPWKKVTDLTRGIRTGETYYLGAAQKMGKSEVVNTIAAHLIKEVGWTVMLAKPEEANKKTYKLLAGKIVGKVFHDPKVEFDSEAYDRAGKVLKDKVILLNLYQHVGWETLQGDIRASANLGAKAVFIDPITNLTNGVSAGEANSKLQEIAQELSAMALDLDIAIFIFCHLRNPESGLPHDRGGKVLTSQFAGSRAMGRSCNYMFGLEGNKDPELSQEERNMRHLILLDDREFGEVGDIPLYWDKNTTLFNEV